MNDKENLESVRGGGGGMGNDSMRSYNIPCSDLQEQQESNTAQYPLITHNYHRGFILSDSLLCVADNGADNIRK